MDKKNSGSDNVIDKNVVDKIASYDSSGIGANIANIAKQNFSHDSMGEMNTYLDQVAKKYDEIKYRDPVGFFANTSPAYLFGIARLFGLQTKNKVRYLEIGCGSGSNITTIAQSMPDSEFVSIDLSSKSIQEGKEYAAQLNLKNLEFHVQSFTEITEKNLGKFDIITAHGLFSHIRPELRNEFFKRVKDCLAKDGLFYINYNVSPGWHMASPIIECLNLITKNVSDEQEKQNRVISYLKSASEIFANQKTPYAMAMMQEINHLMSKSYGYLFHNYLEQYSINFLDICSMSNNHGMQYLSETNLNMLIVKDRVPKEVSELDNLLQQQCYLDVFTGNRFRSSIFVNADISINRNITINSIKEPNLYFLCNLNPVGGNDVLSKENIISNNEIRFSLGNTDQQVFHTNPIIKACLAAISKFKWHSVDLETAAKNIAEEYEFEIAKVEENLSFLIQNYLFSGVILPIYNLSWKYQETIAPQPKLNNFALVQLNKNLDYVIGSSYNVIQLDLVSKNILLNCNGNNSIKNLEDLLLEEFKRGNISCNIENKETKVVRAMTNQEAQDTIPSWVTNYLTLANLNGLLCN